MATQTQRRLAAIVLADVVGYSRLMGADDRGTLDAMRTHQQELWDPTIEHYGGRIVNQAGDSALVEFSSAVAAMECSVAIQTGMAERNANIPEGKRIALRFGVNVGEVIVDGDEIYGDGVNIAARLQTLAEPGGIALSGNVYENIANRLDLPLVDYGEHAVKNISRPIHVWRWLDRSDGDGTGSTATPAGGAKPLALRDKPSIAVLPFNNMSGDREQEYFSDGIVEGLTAALSRIRTLFVIARNSSFVFKDKTVTASDVRETLGVNYFLEGSIQKAGNRVRITAQLIETESGAHIWAEKYDGDLSDIFDLQDRIIRQVVGELQPNIRQAEIDRVRRKPPEDLGAYDLAMQALPHVWSLNKADNIKALEILDRALSLDPEYAFALSLAAWCHGQQSVYNWSEDLAESQAQALALARRAYSVSPNDPFTLAVLGTAQAFRNDQQAALTFLERAVSLDPNSAWSWSRLGFTKVYLDRADEAIEHFRLSIELSPYDPMNFNNLVGLGSAYQLRSDFPKAIEAFQRALEENPQAIWIYRQLSPTYLEMGEIARAQGGVELLRETSPGITIAQVRGAMVLPERVMIWICEGLKKAGLPE